MGKCGFIAGWDHTGTHEQRRPPPSARSENINESFPLNSVENTVDTLVNPNLSLPRGRNHHLSLASAPVCGLSPSSILSQLQRSAKDTAAQCLRPNKRVTMGRPGLDRNPVGSAQPNLNQGIASHCSVHTVERVAGAGRSSGVLTSLFTAK